MVRAAGSYPAGRWFESDRRYQRKQVCPRAALIVCTIGYKHPRPHGQVVKTPPFHGGHPSSNLGGVTKMQVFMACFFVAPKRFELSAPAVNTTVAPSLRSGQ